jgi:hypothetical protein
MADIVLQKSIGELVDQKLFSSSLSWTAGGASDSVTWTGLSINRASFPTGSLPRTLDAFVAYDATLGSGQTLALYFDVQNSTNNSTWTDYATEASTVVATGPSGGGRVTGVARMSVAANDSSRPSGTPGVDLNGAMQYIRCNVVPHLSRTGTDTAVIVVAGTFAGFDTLASPQT